MRITQDIYNVGVNDHQTDLFEGQYIVPNGMAYNSYVITDEKIAVLDSVDKKFVKEWLGNIKSLLGERKPDYLIIEHMEPDHSGSIVRFMREYPEACIVGNKKTFAMIERFFGEIPCKNTITVEDNGTLSLGKHNLTFVFAPMVHWPEVMVTYDSFDKVLFSADGFGKFGALDAEEDWACEARRYYFGIVGKYGAQVQALLKKAKSLQIEKICPLHGPALTENLDYYVNLYDIWSSYKSESEGVCIFYTSVYGNTKKAAELLGECLTEKGCKKVVLSDLARSDMAECVEDAFRYEKTVLATTTYNGDIFPFMKHFIDALTERGFKNKTVALMENGTWAPTAARIMRTMLEKCKDVNVLEAAVTIKSAVDEEAKQQIEHMAQELCM